LNAFLCSLLLLAARPSSAFYLPGVAPTSYQPHDKVPLYVNHLTPALSEYDAQLHSTFSFDYYHPAFGFCQPDGGPQQVSESLGSILFGDRILTSPFELHMAQDETCKALCEEKKFAERSSKFVNKRIWQGYNLNWLIDGLPAAERRADSETNAEFYSPGFALGTIAEAQPQFHNHYDITIEYHRTGRGTEMRVVGVIVEPSSRRNSRNLGDGKADCGSPDVPLVLNEDGETSVTFTYGVQWRESPTAWATRWDKYLHVFDPKVHWFSLITSAITVVFLSGVVGMILLRALKKDITRYNRLDSFNLDDLSGTSANMEDGVLEDSGWKLVHGDVFRSPKYPLLLSVFLGNGAQLFVMTGITIAFALFGFLSPSNRGSIGTIMILLYTIFGSIGGYVSARVYKTFGGEAWKRNIVLTPLMIPSTIFAVFFLLNLFLWAKQSSGAVPFLTMLVLVSIWFTISVPLSFAGSWVGFKQPVSLIVNSEPFNYYLLIVLGRASTRPYESDPPPDSTQYQLPPPDPKHARCRCAPFRRHLHRAVFHNEQHLVQPSVLYVRLPLCLLRPHDHELRGSHYLDGVFPALQRELSLAMAQFLDRRRQRRIHVWERAALLADAIQP